jgi:hypothetical protein
MLEPTIARNFTRSRSGTLRVGRLLEDPPLELQQRQLPVDVEVRAIEVGSRLAGTIVDFGHGRPRRWKDRSPGRV